MKRELREANQRAKELQAKVDGIDSKHRQALYDLRLELEDKARKQMVGTS